MRGGSDIRVINIYTGWLIILEKLALSRIKQSISEKINQQQLGFRKGSDCNMAKILTWYNSSKMDYKKLLLIDIRKAFDSIDRKKLKEMIQTDFKENDKTLLMNFIDIYEQISLEILGKVIYPSRGGPKGSSIVPLLFCYYLDHTIKNCWLHIPFKLQLYEDDIITQAKTIEDLNDIYFTMKSEFDKIGLLINTDKCNIISDDVTDVIKDNINDKIIIPKKG